MAADKVLKNFSLSLDGYGFAGNLDEVQLPQLSITTEDFRAGGMDAPMVLDMGMEKLETTFTTSKRCEETLRLFGVASGSAVACVVRGALEDPDGTVTPVTATMRGRITSVQPSAWTPGSKATDQYSLALQYYKYEQGGNVLHEIDIPNMIRIVNGVDQLAEKRRALGI